ncbi:hypothetical protein C1646_764885 [Rhizophagus diaphanus]|nr:hypothetical protein C1646_764885 [Rhizophagus diaphanus] [Rhizophagus sp. MUCL 43196]
MKLNHIPLFISLSIILLTLSSVKSSIIFEENQPLSAEMPRVFNIDYYDDNTMVVRIVRKDPSKIQCFEEYLSIRTIYPNGTVKGFDLPSDTLNMQPFNFCIPPKYSKANPLRFYPVKKNFLLITYAEADDITNPFTYNDWGIVIDLDGVIHSKIKLGPSFVDNTTKEWKPGQDSITLNVHRDNGFIRTAPITNSTGHPLETVATMDGGYALIYPNNTGLTGSTTISTTPLTPQFGIYFLLLGYEKGITQGPFVLYQTLTPINVLLLDCDFTYVGVGQTCIIIANSTQSEKTFIKIDFLSSGTVYNITTFQNINVTDYSIQSLRYGGYFTYYLIRSSDKKNFNIYGYILDYYGTLFNWDLTYPTLANPVADVLVLPNNTLVIPQPEEGNSWSLLTTDLYKIEGERDHGYDTLHINTTIPIIGDVINPSETKFLIIKYYNKIVLSPNRNITILQDDGTSHGIIRQKTSMTSTGNNGYDKFVELIDDEFSSIINITIIDSTFNKPGGRYYVLIDDGFASSKDYHEPMIGIQSSAWNFTTLQEDDHANSIKEKYQKKVNSTSINGKVRLTLDGTNYFKSIKNDKIKRKEFFNNLTKELAKAIPVSSERVTSSERHEIDTSVSPQQYILSINIEKAKNDDENSVNTVADDLDTLIKNKFITLIGSGEYSNYLDHDYGYKTIPRWIEENWKNLIITVLLNIVLVSFSFKKDNFAIFDCGNAIEEFVTTILFTSVDAGSVENIFTTSIFFVTFPFIVNLGFAFIIIIDELTRTDLKKSLIKVNELLNNETDLKKSEKASNHPEIVSEPDHTEDMKIEVASYLDHTKDMKIEVVSDLDHTNDKKMEVASDLDHTKDKKIKEEDGPNPKEDNKLIKELKKVVKELKKSIEELEDVSKLTKELKEVNELINQLVKYIAESAEDEVKYISEDEVSDEIKDISEDKVKNNKEVNVKNIIEKLKVINELIKEIMQFEDFVNELKELEKLPKEILTSTLKKVEEFTKDPENDKALKEEYTNLKTELKKVNVLNVDEFTKDPEKDKPLKEEYTNLKAEFKKVNELNVDEFTKDPVKDKALKEEYTNLKAELEKVNELNELAEELKKINEFTEKLDNGLMKGLKEVKELAEELEKVKMFIDKLYENKVEDDVEEDSDINEMKNNENSEAFNLNKESWYSKIINKIKKFKTKEENDRQSTQKKGYQKFSKWLKNYRDNQIMTVLFIILAGVDITHLEFLGSKIQIRIPSNFNLLELKRSRSFNIYFNAKLSRAAERKIMWGKFFNALIGDISLIFLQFFYVTQVVSLGYTPVYNILNASIDLFRKGFTIITYVRNKKVTTNT